MKPADAVHLAPGCVTHALAEPGSQYAVLIEGPAPVEVSLNLPAGRYRAEWVNVLGDASPNPIEFDHVGRLAKLNSPMFESEIALKVVALHK
jgi:hypothetical protein